MELTENILERNGCPIHYWMGGKADAPLVIFTHGATIDHHEWDATLPIVGEHFRVLAWDMRGHGLSRPATFHLDEAVADLLALLDRLEVREATFVGHSMGGNLHQEFAYHHPERVKALVMLDCTWNFQKLTPSEEKLLKMAEPIFRMHPYSMLLIESLYSTASSKESRSLLRRSMNLLTKDEFIQIMMASTLCLHYEPGYTINKPLLLMVGDKDQTGNIRKAMPLWAKHEGVDLVVIPNAKHAANLDQPEIFHRIIMDFLQRHAVH
jgi:pimeloyl-ACP methyl ester carboxylesterase